MLRLVKLQYALLALIIIAPINEASAWGKFGHVTVCEIAHRTTTDVAREKINRLIEAHGEYTVCERVDLRVFRFSDRI